jgi:tetratricopeptide (TPR) repeat protein
MRGLAAGLVWLALGWGQPSVPERVQRAPLTPEQRSSLSAALAAKDYPAIEKLLTAAADGGGGQAAELYALLGAIDFLGRRTAEAARALRLSDALAPLAERDRFTLAMALVNQGDTAGARAELERLNREQPQEALFLYWLARLDYDQRRYETAVARLERVVELDPQSPRGYDNLGLCLDMLGRYEEALAAFEKATALNRRMARPSAWPPQNLGYLLLRLDRPEEAEAALRESLTYDGRFALAHYRLGRVLEKRGSELAAVEEYRTATSLDSSLVEPYYSLGLLYRRLKRSKEAEAAFAEYRRRKAASGK